MAEVRPSGPDKHDIPGDGVGESTHDQSGVAVGNAAVLAEVTEVVAHLLSDEASYPNEAVYIVDGGETAGIIV